MARRAVGQVPRAHWAETRDKVPDARAATGSVVSGRGIPPRRDALHAAELSADVAPRLGREGRFSFGRRGAVSLRQPPHCSFARNGEVLDDAVIGFGGSGRCRSRRWGFGTSRR